VHQYAVSRYNVAIRIVLQAARLYAMRNGAVVIRGEYGKMLDGITERDGEEGGCRRAMARYALPATSPRHASRVAQFRGGGEEGRRVMVAGSR